MKLPPFAYAAPETLEEAVALKAAHGDDALLLAGGQSLVPLLALRLANPSLVVDLNHVTELEYIREERGWLLLGAMTRHRAVERSTALRERLPILADALPLIGHRAIRNRGTVGGSIAHADPAAEWPALALALDGAMVVTGHRGVRNIDAGDFFQGLFSTALEPDEILQEVRIRLPESAAGTAFVEFARRHGDFGLAGVAAALSFDAEERVSTARIALLGVGGTPVRATEAERQLEGQALTEEGMRAAAATCREVVQPPSDVHGSAAYRLHLLGVLIRRTLLLAKERARKAVT
jgi:aerobic carbon-monoxide dehydrogenase medium subunit